MRLPQASREAAQNVHDALRDQGYDSVIQPDCTVEVLGLVDQLGSPRDSERYVEEVGLGPGQRRDSVTGGIAYSAAWL